MVVVNALGEQCPIPVVKATRALREMKEPGTLEILVHNNTAANKYVKEVKWNGKTLDKPFITHEELIQGGQLEFTMNDTHQ